MVSCLTANAARLLALVIVLVTPATVFAQKSILQLFLAQHDTPLESAQVSVHQNGQVVGVCSYATASKDFYLTPLPPNVQTKQARCNFMLDVGKPVLLVPNGKVLNWYCPPNGATCQNDPTFTPDSQNRVAVPVMQGGAPLPPSATPKPPKMVNFQLFLAQKNAPLNGLKAWIMQDGKQIGACNYATATKGNFPLMRPADVHTDMAFCNVSIDTNRPALILYDGGTLLGWHCPPGQFANCQTDSTIAPGEAQGGAVMVFKGGEPLVNLKLFVKSGGNLGAGNEPAVKLYHGFKEIAWCGPTSGGAVINGYRICEHKLPKGSYAVVPMSNAQTVKPSCTAPTPSGICLNALAFQLQSDSYLTAEVYKK